MNADRLLALYEKVAEAPDAIARLRRFVLDLAVRGKLVAQEAADEPARPKQGVKSTDLPFDLPTNWRWMRVGDQLDLLNGMAFKPTDWVSSGTRIVRIQNLNKPEAPFNHCRPEMARERSLIDDGSFLISWSGTPGTSFGAFIWDRGPAVLNQHIFRCDFKTSLFNAQFLKFAVNGRLDEMIAKAHGGVGLQHITKGKLEAMLLPLPPLAEQRRIVAKVEELMALLDRLETARTAREATRDRLTVASLTRLTAPDADAADFPANARFALATLPALTTRHDQIKPLRQTILNLAVRGKLVKQDPTDEPVSDLLKRIAAEKKRLGVKHSVVPLGAEEVPFELPAGWSWTRVGEICSKTGSGSTPRGGKDVYKKSGVPFLRSQNVYNDGLRLDDVAFIDAPTHKRMKGTHVLPGDLLLNITGGSMGRCGRVPYDFGDANISQHVAIIRPAVSGMEAFLHSLVLSPYFQAFIFDEQTGAGRGGLPKNRMDKIAVALPPLAEQNRIVAKVDALMALCDRLETALTTADTTRARLLEALLHEALAPAAEAATEAAE